MQLTYIVISNSFKALYFIIMCLGFCLGMTNPIVQPNDKALFLSKALYALMWCEVALAILYFTSVTFVLSGIMELMLAILLYLASRSYIQGHIIVFLFIQMLNLITIFCYLGGLVQHKMMFKAMATKSASTPSKYSIYTEIVCLIAFAFYVVCIVFAFLSYREFKALYLEQHMNRRFADDEERRPVYRGQPILIGGIK
jgi:hypothetical protein